MHFRDRTRNKAGGWRRKTKEEHTTPPNPKSPPSFVSRHSSFGNSSFSSSMARILITSAIPYINGIKHLPYTI